MKSREKIIPFFRSGRDFHVYLTKSGEKMKKQLDAENIPVTLIHDMAIGYIINKVGHTVKRKISKKCIIFSIVSQARGSVNFEWG